MSPSFEHPAAPLWRGRVLDASIVLIAAGLSLPALYTGASTPSVAVLLALVAANAPLMLRRRHPVAVFAVTLGAAVVGALVVQEDLSSLAAVVALYTVAAQQRWRTALVCAALLEVAAVVEALSSPELDLRITLVALTSLVAAALGLGLFTGTRRAYLAELRDRAERLERERDQQGELAAAAERSRIAREIHDIVAHHLTVIVALSDGAVAASAASPARAAEAMRTVSATGREALTDTRRLLGVLRDESGTSQDGPPRPAPNLDEIDALIQRVREAGLPVVHEVHGSADLLAPGLQLTAYRLVQEALTNSLKHAGVGASATVRLRHAADELVVEVRDDGAGRTVGTLGTGGGLVGMRERVAAFGGVVTAGPRPGGGWAVVARLPRDGTHVPLAEMTR